MGGANGTKENLPVDVSILIEMAKYCEIIYDEGKEIEDNEFAYKVVQDRGVTIIIFRGTNNGRNVLTDLDARPFRDRKLGVQVHRGFRDAAEKLRDEIISNHALEETIILTGHSLGGALATLAASRWNTITTHLYTYGSPRVGGRKFVKSFLSSNRYRFRNNNDIVTRVPFEILGYKHVSGDGGKFIYFDVDGNVSKKFSRWYMFKQWLKGTLRGFGKLKVDGFSDHSIEAYYNFCRKELVK